MIPVIEKATPQEIKILQEQKLRELLVYLSEKSPYYKQLFLENNISISAIKTIEDLQYLPTTTKTNLQLNNDDFFCVPMHEIIDYATTSGTLGSPVTFGLTENDLERLAYNEAISFACAGIKKGDVVQLMTTMDRRFMAGLAYFLGLRKLGAGVIRVGAGIPELQWDSILKYQPKYLIAVPSFLLKLIEYAENNQINYQESSVEGVICIGESLREQDLSQNLLASKITEKWDIKLYSTYASTEMSTAFTECSFQLGGHQHPELIITDLDLGPGPTGIDLINKMDKEFPEIKLAVLTAHSSPNLVDIRFKGLPSRVQYIVKADLHASNSFENILKNAFEQKTTITSYKTKPVDAIYLSNTQAELLKLIAQGLSNQAIADKRGTTLRAVEALINRTYQALKLNENDSMNLRVEAVKLWKSSKIHVK